MHLVEKRSGGVIDFANGYITIIILNDYHFVSMPQAMINETLNMWKSVAQVRMHPLTEYLNLYYSA